VNQSKAVIAWLESYDNPMKEVVSRVRDTILHADARIKESMKGRAPTVSYRGTLASIFPESRKHASVMFERGAEIPGHHPRLEGEGDTGRVMKIRDTAEAHAVKDDLQHLVRSWCDWRDADAAESAEVKARAAKKPATRKKAERPAAKKKAASRKKAARPAAKKKAARPAAKKKAGARKKAARPAAKKAGTRKKAARPAAKKKAAPRKKAARPAAKSAARKVSARTRASRPVNQAMKPGVPRPRHRSHYE
jgi:hypothetical protein